MGVGRAVRSRLGALEVPVANLYRSCFINLCDCAATVASIAPEAKSILEIGAGDGQFAQQLLQHYPDSEYLGIDVAPTVGRLFSGDRSSVSFRPVLTGDLLAEGSGPYDLVVVVDVLHHVPEGLRDDLFRDIRALTRVGGHYVIKEWEPTRTLGHAAAYLADRWISGERISFLSADDLLRRSACGTPDPLVAKVRIPPRRNNLMIMRRRARSAHED